MDKQKQEILMDVDTGVDDALSILLAIKSDMFTMRGITTTAGNTNVRQATINTLKVLNLVNRLDIPVFKGSANPLQGRGKRGKTHGKDGLCDVRLRLPDKKPEKLSAKKFIFNMLSQSSQKVVMIATAPLTNIATVLKENPEIHKKIKMIYIMGGAVGVSGNITPFAEFNFYSDPEAVKIVFKSKVSVALAPLDVTQKIYLTSTLFLKKYGQSKDAITQFIVSVLNNRYKLKRKNKLYLHDPLVTGVAINKNFVEFQKEKLGIITSGRKKGRIVRTNDGAEVEWAFRVKRKAFLNYFEEVLCKK